MSVHAQAQTAYANMGINMHYTPDKTYKWWYKCNLKDQNGTHLAPGDAENTLK